LPELGAPRRIWFGEVFNEDGTRKSFDPSVTMDLAYMDTILKHETPQNRVFPSDNVKGFTPEKGDATSEEADSGAIRVIKEGVVTHTAVFWVNDPYKYKAMFDSWKCKQVGAWIEDTNGNLIGEATSDGKLGGRRIEVNSMVSTVTDPLFGEGAKLTVKWSYELVSGDEKVSYIAAADFASDFTTDAAVGLLDVDGEFVGVPGQTGGTYKIYLVYGSVGNEIPVTGLGVSNIEGYNETTPGSVTLLTFTDALVDGTYVYTHASQTATNVLHMQGVTTTIQKNKYDTKSLNAVTGIIT
jgi:hypothetical protein